MPSISSSYAGDLNAIDDALRTFEHLDILAIGALEKLGSPRAIAPLLELACCKSRSFKKGRDHELGYFAISALGTLADAAFRFLTPWEGCAPACPSTGGAPSRAPSLLSALDQ
jgi:hypothetical protein